MKIRNTVFVALLVAVSVLLAPVYGPQVRASAASNGDDLDKDMHSVASAFALVEKNFADKVDSQKAFYQGVIPGMLHTLDPHSSFVDPAEYREMQRRQHAQYYGVGMAIMTDGPRTVVMEPFPRSPAWNADLRRGDVISAVDGKETLGVDSTAVADMLRGPKGTQVKVSVKRDNLPEPYTATVTRGEIETSVVDAFWVKPGIAYLGVTTFEAQNVSRDTEALLRKMAGALRTTKARLPSAVVMWYICTMVTQPERPREIQRVQTGIRIEKRLLKVLKAVAELKDLAVGDLLEGILLHVFEGKTPFSGATLRQIGEFKKIYGCDLKASDSHQLKERRR